MQPSEDGNTSVGIMRQHVKVFRFVVVRGGLTAVNFASFRGQFHVLLRFYFAISY